MLVSEEDNLICQSESHRATVKSIQDTKLYFGERVEEIDEFFKYLEILSDRKTKISQNDQKVYLERDFLAILKSNGILLLYNLIESTVRFLIENIFHDIAIKRCHFDDLNSTFKQAVFKNLKDVSPENSAQKISQVSFDIIQLGRNPQKDYSGNLDIRKIKDIGRKYGIELRFPPLESNQRVPYEFDENILMVKKRRNDLSHGNLTFIECGKDISLEELIKYKKSTEFSLNSLLGEIKNYICEQGYLKENE